MNQANTFDLRPLRQDFGADSGFTDAQLLAGLTVPAILDPSRRSIPEDEVIELLPVVFGNVVESRRTAAIAAPIRAV